MVFTADQEFIRRGKYYAIQNKEELTGTLFFEFYKMFRLNNLYFPDVTLLITHYNRSSSLERELDSFEQLGMKFGEIVVSDDGSKKEHLINLHSLKKRYPFRLVETEENRGLGNNINKGQDTIQTPFTLYVQEDFIPQEEFPQALVNALDILKQDQDIDIARFYAYERFPYLTPLEGNFSKMNFKFLSPGYKKFYYYSDHPHLRRKNFFQKFGKYKEGLKGDQTEYNMMISFISNGGKGIFYQPHQSLFHQVNTEQEPSTMKRNFFRNSENFFIAGVRHLYRHVKFNLDYLRYKSARKDSKF
ncbi:MAG: glycosyltransferase [Candidatus Dadabacteria bacterium]